MTKVSNQALRDQLTTMAQRLEGEDLRDAVEAVSALAVNANHDDRGEPIVSYSLTGEGFTEKAFFSRLDERAERAARGEGTISAKEFRSSIASWRTDTE